MTTPLGEWTFWADQAVPPHNPIGPVSVTGFSCSWALSGFGAGEAIVPVEESGLTRTDLLRFWGWRLWAFYEGQPVWAGFPTDLEDTGGAAVSLAFTELTGYLNKKQHAMVATFDQVEQTEIAWDLARRLDNISVPIVREPGPGFLRDRRYEYLEGESRGGLLANLSEVIEGPEFRSEYYMTGGRPGCRLRIAYPRAGRETGLGLTVPGGASTFRARWSAEKMRTRTFAVGELPENAEPDEQAPVEVVVLPQAGIPAIDEVDNWPSVILRETLKERAETASRNYARPVLTLEAEMPVSAPVLGSYGVGDDVAVNITDALMPGGLITPARLVSMRANAGAGSVAWTVSNVLPAPKPHDTLTARLDYLGGITTGLFHARIQNAGDGGIDP